MIDYGMIPIIQTENNEPPIQKRIVGFYSGKEFTEITQCQLRKLTHAVFASVLMTSEGQLEFVDDSGKQRFMDLSKKTKEANVKMMFSIGGDISYFRIFLETIVSFIKTNQINGVNIFWKWPTYAEKSAFSSFLKELRQKMNSDQLLSITAPATGIENWEAGFDLDGILNQVDFVNVWSMDYCGPWENQWGAPVGPSAPLYNGVGLKTNFNVNYTMEYYIGKTEQPEKFNIVIPFYARLWKNVTTPIAEGREIFRNSELFDAKPEGSPYMSMWTVDHEKWTLSDAVYDETTKTSYIYNLAAKSYLTFETGRSIADKTNYAKTQNLGGIWIWLVDMDDHLNSLLNMTKHISITMDFV
ncbi:unnamed protein product [Caenorhabditis nigoni]